MSKASVCVCDPKTGVKCGYHGDWMGKTAQTGLPWHPSESIVAYRKPDGRISYPGRNDRPTPPGHERIVMRNDHEVAKFERDNHVINEKRHFDSNGRGAENY